MASFDLDFLPKTDWRPTAGLGGAIEGMRTGLGMAWNDRNIRDSDLNYEGNRNKLDELYKDQEVIGDTGRQKTRLENLYTTEDISSGRKLERDSADTQYKKALTGESEERTREAKVQALGRTAEQLLPHIDPKTGLLPPHMYAKAQEYLASQGLPQLPPDSKMAAEAIQKFAQGYRASGQNYQNEQNRTTKVQVAELSAGAKVEVQRMKLEAMTAKANAATGKPLSVNQLAALVVTKMVGGEKALEDPETAKKALELLAEYKAYGKDHLIDTLRAMGIPIQGGVSTPKDNIRKTPVGPAGGGPVPNASNVPPPGTVNDGNGWGIRLKEKNP